jgi:hypothetical protein
MDMGQSVDNIHHHYRDYVMFGFARIQKPRPSAIIPNCRLMQCSRMGQISLLREGLLWAVSGHSS